MPRYHTIAFTSLELKGLWVRGTGGSTTQDKLLDQAAERAVHKVYCAERGILYPGQQHGPLEPKRGPGINTRGIPRLD